MPNAHRGETEEDIVGSLRRAAQMADEEVDQADYPRDESGSQATTSHLRPWTIEAAMEPLPPLAPPVDTPMTDSRPATQQATASAGRISSRVIAEVVALIILIVVAIVLLARHG